MIRRKIPFAAVLLSILVAATPAEARFDEGPIGDCYRLAAFTEDPDLPEGVTGVPFYAISTEAAIAACAEAAALVSPTAPRHAQIVFMHARALHAAGQGLEAVRLYQQAVEAGFVLALNNLGFLYQRGTRDVPANPRQGVVLLQRAANAGIPVAQFNLAQAYQDGVGTEPDAAQALALYRQAAEGGYLGATQRLAQMLEAGEGVGAPDFGDAAEHWRALAATGDADAAYTLATRLRDGDAVPAHDRELIDLYGQAIEAGHALAAYAFAELLRDGHHVQADAERALHFAYLAYDRLVAALANTQAAWLPYQHSSASLIVSLVDDHGQSPRDSGELEVLRADFPADRVSRFTAPMICDDDWAPFDFHVWDWTRSYPMTVHQFEWVEAVHGCVVWEPLDHLLNRLWWMSQENGSSFVDAAVDALGHHAPADRETVAGIGDHRGGPVGAEGCAVETDASDCEAVDTPEVVNWRRMLHSIARYYRSRLSGPDWGFPPITETPTSVRETVEVWRVETDSGEDLGRSSGVASNVGVFDDDHLVVLAARCSTRGSYHQWSVSFELTPELSDIVTSRDDGILISSDPFITIFDGDTRRLALADVSLGRSDDPADGLLIHLTDDDEALAFLRMIQDNSQGFRVELEDGLRGRFVGRGSRHAINGSMWPCVGE